MYKLAQSIQHSHSAFTLFTFPPLLYLILSVSSCLLFAFSSLCCSRDLPLDLFTKLLDVFCRTREHRLKARLSTPIFAPSENNLIDCFSIRQQNTVYGYYACKYGGPSSGAPCGSGPLLSEEGNTIHVDRGSKTSQK